MFPLSCLMTVLVTQSGGVNPTMLALSITHASVPALVAFPWLSPCIHHYLPTPPNPCALGQQVTAYRLPYCLAPPCVLIVWI